MRIRTHSRPPGANSLTWFILTLIPARAEFKINTHRCWNWHLCRPVGLSVVQCHLDHVIMIFYTISMMTSSNGNVFRDTGPLCGEFTGHRWIPSTKASDAELWCSLWSAPWINGWINNREAGDLRHHRAHYNIIVVRGMKRTWWTTGSLLCCLGL